MKKLLAMLCLAAILYVGYLAITLPHDESDLAIDGIKAEADKIVNQMTDMYEEYGSATTKRVEDAIGEKVEQAIGEKVEQADEALGEIAGQADEVIEDAARSAVEGAKQGFIGSLKESVNGFFDKLADEDAEE